MNTDLTVMDPITAVSLFDKVNMRSGFLVFPALSQDLNPDVQLLKETGAKYARRSTLEKVLLPNDTLMRKVAGGHPRWGNSLKGYRNTFALSYLNIYIFTQSTF